ncbi:arylformamidase [Metabacillus litoralis]|uniref:arylformamidase n=1 Tax=Metabacillus litoralis TaxID=152268 RepID=UPI001CFE0F42|nr:arylformamidase [Metabacillus litoralis]
MSTNKWIDISQPLTNDIAHWPGDTAFTYDTAFSKKQTGSVNIGKITTSLHTGTHIDAPFHFHNEGEKVLDLDINLYVGHAKLIDVSSFNKIDCNVLSRFDLEGVSRLLLKTVKHSDSTVFPAEIPYLSEDIAPFLKEKGVFLLGVDVPSVDPLDSKDMKTHHALYQHHIHILENIVVDHVEEGDYELIALPLPIKEGDGSPVRAVIRQM